MKDKKLFLSILFVLVITIAASGFLYNKFKDDVNTTTLLIYDQDPSKTNTTVTGTVPREDAKPTNKPTQDPVTGGNEPEQQVEPEKKTPSVANFTVYDANGNEVDLHDFIGKPIVLNFWASWCGPCKSEMPDFEEAYRKYGNEVQFLMVNLTDGSYETVSSASNFISSKGYTFPVFYDTTENAANTYSIYSIPTTFFISKDGHLVAQATGAISADTLEQGIGLILEA